MKRRIEIFLCEERKKCRGERKKEGKFVVEIEQLIKQIYSQRQPWSHKGQMGKLLVVAGSKKYTGSPIFNAVSALKSGCDLVTVAAPKRVADICVCAYPDIITAPLKGDFLHPDHVPEILKLAKDNKALVIGGGLGREKETLAAILEIIKKVDLPMVVDADALRALAGRMEVLEGKKVILTPHADEFFAISGERVREEVGNRRRLVQRFATQHHAVVILKGHVDIVAEGDAVYENRSGSVYMTKGGFGDTLTGICGALLFRGTNLFGAACAGAYLNGKAGELAAINKKEGVLASDIFEYLPKAIESVLYPEPAVLGNVVILQKAILADKEGKILTLKRSTKDRARPGRWDFPGGRLEEGEKAPEGVKREIKEETGLPGIQVTVFTAEVEYESAKERTWIYIGYKSRVKDKPKINLSCEHEDYRWVSKEEFLKLESAEFLQRMIKKLP